MTSEFDLKHVSLHGHDLAYRRAGRGPTLLLIHGMAGSSRAWRAVMPELADRYDVIAPDLPGHGQSESPGGDYSLGNLSATLRDLLVVIGVERATIVGQSLGGGVAMQFVYQHPELAERLVLVGSGGLGREVSWMIRALSLPGAEYVAPAIFPGFVRDAGNRVADFAQRIGVRAPRLAEMWDAYASLTTPEHRTAFLRTVRAVIEPGGQAVSASDRLYLAATMPTLIVWGDADSIIPVSHAHEAHAAMAGSRLEIFPGVGHFPHAEDPERFAGVLLDFLATTDPAVNRDTASELQRRSHQAV
ncbi:MAG: alpha/beta fold hydrolase [Acidimicrobiia bacterium]|nr:alpha/beta fold hydrolase [Acidimicrobiia bacterium]